MAPFLGISDSDSPRETLTPTSSRSISPSPSGHGGDEDVAIIGMGCRLPGGINNPEDLWEALMSKKVASGDIPEMRWEPYYRRDARNSKILDQTTKKGYFLDNIADFDASFFGVSPKEAVLMDPQQRLTLEVTWEALEDAGISPQSLAGSNTAVFTGVNSDDYSKLLLEDLPGVEAWMGIGTAYCGVPNRISYLLDLRGPSTAVDAACASSLVAVHHGRQSLLTKESDLAIVGGVNALCGPGLTRVLDEAGAISKDGVCRSFDDSANGYGRGEGAGIVIMKRMSEALRDNDRIVAVLKGSAVGQDGRTNGIMAPNGQAQEHVARTALASVNPLTIQYVEAHATSTLVGDPVEIGAMSRVYGATRDPTQPCYVGSVKANVGHLEAGAGVIGLIKAAMALEKSLIPPQANVQKLNQKINWKNSGIDVALVPTKWPQTSSKRRAAVCSYGYGGTVAHAVLEAAPAHTSVVYRQEENHGVPRILTLSAPQEKRLVDVAGALAEWLPKAGAKWSLEAIGAALATRRGEHDFRAAIVATSHEQAKDEMEKLMEGVSSPNCITSRTLGKSDRKDVVWLFSGHGAQWPQMGQELLAKDAVFSQTVQNLDTLVSQEAGFSPLDALTRGDFSTSDKIQVLTYIMQIALAGSLHSKGVRPGAVIGHSVGEIAAAVVAGALSAVEGAIVVCRRARLYKQVMGKGAMILVNQPFDDVASELKESTGAVAAIDCSPTSCVVSGSVEAIDKLEGVYQTRSVKTFRVKSDIAFHSPLLEPLSKPLKMALDDVLHSRTPHTPLYSTAMIDPRQAVPRDSTYWVRNMINPVLLTSAVRAAAEDGFKLFLEVSSHPIISHSVNETLMSLDIDDSLVIPSLLRNKPAADALLKAVSNLWCRGASIDFQSCFAGLTWATDLPNTKWRHQPYWKEIGAGSINTEICHDPEAHTLLGRQIPVAGSDAVIFTSKLDDDTRPFPGRHPLHGTEIVPAAVLFNTFFKATNSTSLSEVQLRVPVAISAPRDIQVVVQDRDLRIMSRLIQSEQSNASWLTHTTARHGIELPERLPQTINIQGITSRIGQELGTTFTIDYLAAVGVPIMGFPWTVVKHWGNTQEMLAKVDVCPTIQDGQKFPWQSSSWAPVFDAATSIGSTLFFNEPRLRMPAHVANVTVVEGAAPPKIAYIHVEDASSGNIGPASDVTVTDESGTVLAKFTSMRFSEIEASRKVKDDVDSLVHVLAWPPARLSESAYALDHVILLGENTAAARYQLELKTHGIKVDLVDSPAEIGDVASSTPITIVYVPESSGSPNAISETAESNCKTLLDVVKTVAAGVSEARIFVLTQGALQSDLSNSALVGLSRIIAAEQPDIWGSLVDVESTNFPFQAVKYVTGADVVKVEDTVARVARLRPMPAAKQLTGKSQLDVRPEGTYLITGGLGDLGFEVANSLVEKGARRIVLISRRSVPARKTWTTAPQDWRVPIDKIQALESKGACVHTVAADIASANAAEELSNQLDMLNLPPVLGVVHAAGVIDDQYVLSTDPATFNRVLAPKIRGALALHTLFPPQSLSFFVLFSSCGQLFGFPGQASYAAGNSFLDSLAEHRRAQGDNTLALQYTSWRGMGLAATTEASADFIEAELESKGITSVSKEEALSAWEHAATYDLANAVVLRCRELDHDEPLPVDIIEDVAIRKQAPVFCAADATSGSAKDTGAGVAKTTVPPPGPERSKYLVDSITGCVATVLQLDASDVDSKAALPDLGMDSVMTVALRKQLQKVLGVKVPPTLVWGHPTVQHLAKWFEDKM